MVTLGDVSALMLTFFVMLLSFSSFDESPALRKVMGVMEGATGRPTFKKKRQNRTEDSSEKSQPHRKKGRQFSAAPGTLEEPEMGKKTYPNSIRKKFVERQDRLKSKEGEKSTTYAMLQDGVHIRISRQALFRNAVQMRAKANDQLQGAANLAENVENEIRIIDCIPKKGSTISNRTWGNALTRASKIGDILHEEYKLEKSRLGYGTEVVASDKEPYVDIVILEELGTNEISYGKLTEVFQ